MNDLRSSIKEYIALIDNVINSLDSSILLQSHGQKPHKTLQLLLEEEVKLQAVVDKLIINQTLQHEIRSVQTQIANADQEILKFATELGNFEQSLYENANTRHQDKVTNLQGKLTQNKFTIHELLVLAEKLGLMSFAPADFLERKGKTTNVKPPAPLEQIMPAAKLNLSVQELLQLSRNKRMQMNMEEKTPEANISTETEQGIDLDKAAREAAAADRQRILAQQSAARVHAQQLLVDFAMELNPDSDESDEESSGSQSEAT
jgi:hypothetical protein